MSTTTEGDRASEGQGSPGVEGAAVQCPPPVTGDGTSDNMLTLDVDRTAVHASVTEQSNVPTGSGANAVSARAETSGDTHPGYNLEGIREFGRARSYAQQRYQWNRDAAMDRPSDVEMTYMQDLSVASQHCFGDGTVLDTRDALAKLSLTELAALREETSQTEAALDSLTDQWPRPRTKSKLRTWQRSCPFCN